MPEPIVFISLPRCEAKARRTEEPLRVLGRRRGDRGPGRSSSSPIWTDRFYCQLPSAHSRMPRSWTVASRLERPNPRRVRRPSTSRGWEVWNAERQARDAAAAAVAGTICAPTEACLAFFRWTRACDGQAGPAQVPCGSSIPEPLGSGRVLGVPGGVQARATPGRYWARGQGPCDARWLSSSRDGVPRRCLRASPTLSLRRLAFPWASGADHGDPERPRRAALRAEYDASKSRSWPMPSHSWG